jgi:metal transporter CNNM
VVTINERSTFTYELNKGLIVDVEKEAHILLYLLVNKTNLILNKTILNQTYAFFTTHPTDCDSSLLKQNEIFKVKFSDYYNRLNRINSNTFDNNQTNEAFLLIGDINVKLEHSKTNYYACLNLGNSSFIHQGTDNLLKSIITTKNALPFYAVCVFYLFLLTLSALFSGLNLGLMSLDLTELTILKKCGTKTEKYYAKKIYPLRKKGNFLLCTILLGNVLVNSTSTLILGSYLEGLFAVAGSTILIVIFGEIIPQAACSRYGLAVGTYTRFITYFFMLITSPLSFPLGLILNKVLGKEIASGYSRDKVREMTKKAELADNQKKFISGALDLKNKCVINVMVPINNVFKLDINSCLDFETFRDIGDHGYSRIPLYEHTE